MVTCLQSRAPQAWGTFQRLWNSPAMAFHSSLVIGVGTGSSRNSSMMAWHTSGKNRLMLLSPTRKLYPRSTYDFPVAKWRSVTADFRPGSMASRYEVFCLVMRSLRRSNSSSNKAGSNMVKFLNLSGSLCRTLHQVVVARVPQPLSV